MDDGSDVRNRATHDIIHIHDVVVNLKTGGMLFEALRRPAVFSGGFCSVRCEVRDPYP